MKKQFTTFLMSAAMMLVATAFTACSSDVENFNNPSDEGIEIPTGQTLFSSGETSGMPVINADADGEAKAMLLNGGEETRTSMGGKAVSAKFPFYWEPGDCIWVKSSNYKRSRPTSITSTQPSAQFMLDGTYAAPRYEVYYVGQNSPQAASETANALQVTIADQQTQSAWNDSKHIGTSGDCGSCYATPQNNGSYTFSMDHKASYLIFYPYLHTMLQNDNYTLQKIEIYSDAGGSTIAGTYDFSFTDGLADIPQAGTAKQGITLTCGDAFGLTTAVPDMTTTTAYNHCFVVIAPGTHQLTIRYTVKNASGTEFSFVKDISLKQYAENSVYTFVHELRYAEIDPGYKFYAQHFTSPSNRYCWGATTAWDGNGSANYNQSTSQVTAGHWKNVPNLAAATWYIKGGYYWDNSLKWTRIEADGTEIPCRGGAWLKRKAYITGFSTTTNSGVPNASGVLGRPDASVIEQYFFLPDLDQKNTMRFWTSTPWDERIAYSLEIRKDRMLYPFYSKGNSWLSNTLRAAGPDAGQPWFL